MQLRTVPTLAIAFAAALCLAVASSSAIAAEAAPPKKDGISQKILLDKPVRAGDLILYPGLKNDANNYYYVVNKIRLGRHTTGAPQFSFLRWVDNQVEEEGMPGGGGIIHALVELTVSEEQIRKAEQELGRVNEEAKVAGPVVFSSGTFALITTANPGEEGKGNEMAKQLVGVGKAPLIDGSKAAVSILLTRQGARVLWESFKTPTPDISFSFEMEMKGYISPYNATLTADLESVYTHMEASLKAKYYSVGAEVSAELDDLRKSGAIKLDVIGEDERMDALINTAYDKISNLMFEKAPFDQIPKVEKPPNAAADTVKALGEAGSSSFGATLAFKLKHQRTSGTYKLDFNKFTTASQTLRFDENIGDLRQYWDDSNHFRQVNLEDPLFVEREIVAKLNGVDVEDFEDLLNFVSVTLRKQHEDGESITDREIKIDGTSFKETGNSFPVEYGWKGDNDRTRWLQYDYKVHWSLGGGREVVTDWMKSDLGMIDLTPPLRKFQVNIDGSADELKEAGIRAAIVTLYFDPGSGKEIQRRETFRIDRDQSSRDIEIMLPRDTEAYEYDIKWQTTDGKVIDGERQAAFGSVIFIDPPSA